MAPLPRPEILTIRAYTPGVSHVEGANRVIKLSSNEGAFGPPPGVAPAVAALAGQFHRYPDADMPALRDAIGNRFGLDPARIVCGAGSDDLIYLLCLIYGGALPDGSPTELIMTAHGFSMYEIAGQLAGCRIIKVPERALTADVDAVLAAVTPATRLVFIANPNNPTGTMIPTAEVHRLRAGLPGNVLLVLDAAYAEYVDRADYTPGTELVDAGDNTVMTRTFSKMFGMGGLRLGWAYAPPSVVDLLHRVRGPFNASVAAQQAGIAALAEPDWVEHSRASNAAERARLARALTDAGITVHPSEANFVLADFGTPDLADAADALLRSRGVIVRRVGGYGLPQCLRITVGLPDENDLVIAVLARSNV